MSQRPLADRVAVVIAVAILSYLLLASPYYQGWRSLQLLREHGHFVPITDAQPFPPFGGDFLSEWLGGAIVRSGEAPRLYDHPFVEDRQHDPNFMGVVIGTNLYWYLFYPPVFYLLVEPLSLLPIQLAAMIWLVLMMACLITAARMLAKACPQPPGVFACALLAALFFGPTMNSLNTGQKGTLWLLVLTTTFLLLRRERPFSAGVVFGLLALKPPLTLAIGLSMLWKRQWRFLAGSFLTLGVLVALSLGMGLDVCRAYVQSITGTVDFTMRGDYLLADEHSGYGFFALLMRDAGLAKGTIQGLAALVALAAFVAVLVLCRGSFDFQGERFTLQYAGLVLATALMSLKLQGYDLTILLLAMFLMGHLATLGNTVFAAWRPHLVLAAALLYGVCVCSERVAERLPVQLSVPTTLAVLLFLMWLQGHSEATPKPAATEAGS